LTTLPFSITEHQQHRIIINNQDATHNFGAVSAYTFNNITTDHTISANFATDTSSSTGIIIDNGDEGTSFTGTWKVSGCPNPYGQNSLYSWNSNVRYTYQVPVDGTYTVLLWWTAHNYWRRNSVPV
jgi:hypothetical protein